MAPSGSYHQVDVRCPFYQSDDGAFHIKCEGIMDGCSLTLHYRKKQDFTIQLKTFCCQHYEKCEIYRMLLQKYEED